MSTQNSQEIPHWLTTHVPKAAPATLAITPTPKEAHPELTQRKASDMIASRLREILGYQGAIAKITEHLLDPPPSPVLNR